MVDVKALEMKGISKSFGGVHALTNVHYNAYRGKVNVLIYRRWGTNAYYRYFRKKIASKPKAFK